MFSNFKREDLLVRKFIRMGGCSFNPLRSRFDFTQIVNEDAMLYNSLLNQPFVYNWKHHEMIRCRLEEGNVPYSVEIRECEVYRNIDSPEPLFMVRYDLLFSIKTLEIRTDLMNIKLPEEIAKIPSPNFATFNLESDSIRVESLKVILDLVDALATETITVTIRTNAIHGDLSDV